MEDDALETDLTTLLANVDGWMSLQSENAVSQMSAMQSAHLNLLSTLDAVSETLSSVASAPPTPNSFTSAPTTPVTAGPGMAVCACHHHANLTAPPKPPPSASANNPSANTKSLGHRHGPRGAQPAAFAAALPPPPPPNLFQQRLEHERVLVTRETAEGKQLLESLARWQQMAAEVVRVRLLMAVTADPSTIALKSGLRRWVAGGRERAAEATRLRVLRGRTRRARRSATSVGWKRWCTQLSCVTETRDKRTREDAAAKTHDAAHSTLKAWRVGQPLR